MSLKARFLTKPRAPPPCVSLRCYRAFYMAELMTEESQGGNKPILYSKPLHLADTVPGTVLPWMLSSPKCYFFAPFAACPIQHGICSDPFSSSFLVFFFFFFFKAPIQDIVVFWFTFYSQIPPDNWNNFVDCACSTYKNAQVLNT